jgi:1-acyl-sn-glycerol-3-phosphate acyltransferase
MIAGLLAWLAAHVSGVRARWCGGPPETKARVYFANHTSHLDFVVLWASLPRHLRGRTRPVAARDYWDRGPVRRYVARTAFRALLIDRAHVSAHRNPVDAMAAALDEGESLIVFPEGTRNTGLQMQPFKSGLYHLAKKRPDVDLVPVYLDNLNRILPKGEFLPIPLLSSVTFGPPLRVGEDEGRNAFLARARNAVQELRDRWMR